MNTKNIIIRYYKKLTMREKENRDIIRKSEKRIIDGECESIIKIWHKTDFTFDKFPLLARKHTENIRT